MNKEERLQLEQECLLKYSKAQMIEKYIDEFEENSKLSELWCKSQQENKQLKDRIDKANELLSNILVVKRYDGNYGAVKNTTKKEVYKTICMLNEVLETPHRTYYEILGDKEND